MMLFSLMAGFSFVTAFSLSKLSSVQRTLMISANMVVIAMTIIQFM